MAQSTKDPRGARDDSKVERNGCAVGELRHSLACVVDRVSFASRRIGAASTTQEQTMTLLRTRMIEDMTLAGHAARTQQIYLQAVSALSKHCGNRPPDQLSEEEVRRYLVGIQGRCARGTIQANHYGLQFFYRHTLGVDWALFKKSSGFPSRGVCPSRSPMPRCSGLSAPSAIPSIVAASA